MFVPRLIAVIPVYGGQHVQSVQFRSYRPIGNPAESAKEFDHWEADEIILLFFGESEAKEREEILSVVADSIAVPLTVVGGMRSVEDVELSLSLGADKVGFNYQCRSNPDIVRASVQKYGAQCIVASVDLIANGGGFYRYDYDLHRVSDYEGLSWINNLVSLGVGEIFLNFPDRDGLGKGMETSAIRDVVKSTPIPIIACGGVGMPSHAVDCWCAAAPSGIAIGNMLSHVEHGMLLIKESLHRSGANIRRATHIDYSLSEWDHRGRICQRDQKYLADLLFQKIEPEII